MAADGVLLVSQWLGGGGIERNIETVAVHLRRRGRRVAVASWQVAPEISGRPNPILARLAEADVPVFTLPAHSPLSLLRLGRHVARVARDWGAQAIVGKELAAAIVALLARAQSRRRLWVTAEFHNAADAYVRTGLSPAHRQLGRWLLPRADRRIAVSAATRRDAAAFFCLAPEAIAVIPNPMELPPATPLADWPPPVTPLEIVACGRLQPMKGFDILLQALARLRRQCDGRLTILGEGPQRLALRQLAQRLGVEAACHWAGHVADPRPYFRGAAVVASASIFGESWGLALA